VCEKLSKVEGDEVQQATALGSIRETYSVGKA
jgi:hypothetical protein